MKIENCKLVNFKKYLFFVILFFGVFLLPKSSWATNWYIDKDATGGNNGISWANAWQSFASISWASISSGDTIYISGGSSGKTYNEGLIIGKSGSSGSPITIKVGQDANHNGVVTITNVSGTGITGGTNNYYTIDGEYGGSRHLYITGCSRNGFYTASTDSANIVGVIVRYCKVYSNGANGIYVRGKPNNVEIAYNEVYSNATGIVKYSAGDAVDAIKIHHNIIYNNAEDAINAAGGWTIHDNSIGSVDGSHHDGIQCYGGSGTNACGNVKAYNNVFYGAGHANLYIDPNGPSSNIWIYNNVFYCDDSIVPDCSDIGIKIKPESNGNEISNVYIYENTLIDQQYSAIEVNGANNGSDTASNINIKNNLLYNSYRISVLNWSTLTGLSLDYNNLWAGPSGSSDIHVQGNTYQCSDGSYSTYNVNGNCNQPSLTNYVHGSRSNYHLTLNDTAAKDVGTSLGNPYNIDIDWVPRPQGSGWDIGAYEYVGAAPPDTTPPAPPTGVTVL